MFFRKGAGHSPLTLSRTAHPPEQGVAIEAMAGRYDANFALRQVSRKLDNENRYEAC